jgi:hypothetical protein
MPQTTKHPTQQALAVVACIVLLCGTTQASAQIAKREKLFNCRGSDNLTNHEGKRSYFKSPSTIQISVFESSVVVGDALLFWSKEIPITFENDFYFTFWIQRTVVDYQGKFNKVTGELALTASGNQESNSNFKWWGNYVCRTGKRLL